MGKIRWGAVALLACLLLGAQVAGASNNAAFSDPADDASSAAPDLTSVSVSNDDDGVVTFRISIPNRPALLDPDFVAVLVDADGKASTGCARGSFGAEYALDVLAQRYVFGRCLRGEWNFTKAPASFRGSYGGALLTLQVSRRDLGGATNFKFRVGSAGTSENDAAYDFAPNVGLTPWSYRVVAPRAIKKAPKRHVRRKPKPRRILRP